MSLSRNGKEVICDGPGPDCSGCAARAPLPVGLNRVGAGRPRSGAFGDSDRAIAGWVFVAGGERLRHYCPHCARAFPGLLGSPSPADSAPLPTLLSDV